MSEKDGTKNTTDLVNNIENDIDEELELENQIDLENENEYGFDNGLYSDDETGKQALGGTIELCSDVSGVRLDAWITQKNGTLSRSYVQKLIDEGHVKVNGRASKANYKVKAGDTVLINLPEPERLDIIAEDIKLDILYEDSDIIVINKPKGMVVHPAAGNYTGTLVNALMKHCGESLSDINGVIRPGIVHRIDKDTTC
jgi:23S rRNA-/tRNA-specific pseudouridylate synthase